ncbi:glycosyltransferase family 2 protein [Leptolyngbya sp. FACHB-261]|uniref:glycosyltransferase family 2 protein n=1 Tax=Leptolyngbya sp. FACHB-261 TaxID=2692806 RepID=UPI0016826354|nr:glycosyltransferase family A protein [Leptolyngbya sp. FACHB-261]MBD2103180.1 glycosyltransferase family 2 protein [Leptolyngbya sp. FACHB-261]
MNSNLLSEPYPVSVVICTVDRCESLRSALEAVSKWRASFQELIVVHGPSQDTTVTVLDAFQPIIDKIISTSSRNVSVARNLGLKAASQEIVLYLDDDVVPPPDWLSAHLGVYTAEGKQCGCVAGAVRDKTKPTAPLQFCQGVNSLLSESRPILDQQTQSQYLASPYWFKGVMGANASYRRHALLEVGGFDEFFEYFLEETDACLRLIQSGYEVCHVDTVVDHYPAKSHNRQDQKHLTCWYELAKNTSYFALKHASKQLPTALLMSRLTLLLTRRCLLRILRLKLTHGLSNAVLTQYLREAMAGFQVGYAAGLALHKALEKV